MCVCVCVQERERDLDYLWLVSSLNRPLYLYEQSTESKQLFSNTLYLYLRILLLPPCLFFQIKVAVDYEIHTLLFIRTFSTDFK